MAKHLKSFCLMTIFNFNQTIISTCTFKSDKSQMEYSDDICNITKSFASLKKGLPRSILLTGPSGTGKSTIIYHMSQENNNIIVKVKCSGLVGQYAGTASKRIKNIEDEIDQKLMENIHTKRKIILILEEIDAVGGKITQTNQETNNQRTSGLQDLCLLFDKYEDNPSIVIAATTNHPEHLDETLRTRLKHEIKVNYPNFQAKKKFLIFLAQEYNIPLTYDQLFYLASELCRFGLRELKCIMEKATLEYEVNKRLDDSFFENEIYKIKQTKVSYYDKLYAIGTYLTLRAIIAVLI